MEENKTKTSEKANKVKTRKGSGYLKQLYSTARTTAGTTHSNLKNLTTFMVNFIPVDKVDASELQVRTHFDEKEIEVLAKSIKEHGVLQPILVVQNGDRYKVIAGERRLRASKDAGVDRIPARVITSDDKGTHEIALRENLDRVDLHPIEEGEGYLSLLEAKAYTSHEAISKAFLKPKSRITECIGFTRLPDQTKQELLARGLKNRALLRQLLSTPPEQHLEIIAKATGKEEQILAIKASQIANQQESESPRVKKKETKPFEYQITKKGVKVPLFRWKAGEGKDRLQEYVDAMEKFLNEVKNHLD